LFANVPTARAAKKAICAPRQATAVAPEIAYQPAGPNVIGVDAVGAADHRHCAWRSAYRAARRPSTPAKEVGRVAELDRERRVDDVARV
jgi:hypothetical protein